MTHILELADHSYSNYPIEIPKWMLEVRVIAETGHYLSEIK